MQLRVLTFLAFIIPLIAGSIVQRSPHTNHTAGKFTHAHLHDLRNRTRSLFDHGWDSYMSFGYPADEVKPLSCVKYGRSDDINDIHRNDALGNYSVTFLDTLTTFAVFEDISSFEKYIWLLKGMESFEIDSTVQVFETSIRALGSLLSAHLYASDKFKLPGYDGFLLRLAHDLGVRLMGAYNTPTGIPLARVNLRDGIKTLPNKLIDETCTAGAASPMLEMTLLSILTSDTQFEAKSRNTFFTLWNRRSLLDLIPMSINPLEGNWLNAITGVGASIDSFYEYALKGAVLFDDEDLFSIWKKAYKALSIHSRSTWFLSNVHVETGSVISAWIDSLSAFFPGLLVLAGEIEDAIELHRPFIKLWNKYNGIPERWDFMSSYNNPDEDPISLEWYPLRPEFIESTYHLYQATKDPIYLQIGETVLHDYETIFKAPCGFAGFRDVRTLEKQDRMESFVLSETLMYLYLLFDVDNELNRDDKVVFSTEGHPLWIPKGMLKQYKELKSSEISVTVTHDIDHEDTHSAIVAAIMKTINSWPLDELSQTTGKIKKWLEEGTGNQNEEEEIDASDRVLEKEWLESLGFQLATFESQTCPVVQVGDSMISDYLGREDVFTIDSLFQKKFADSPLELEVSSDFYEIFAPAGAQCFRRPDTELIDYYFGETAQVQQLGYVERLTHHSSEDLWLHDVTGLRIVFEVVRSGQVDFGNNLWQKDVVQSYYDDFEYDVDGTCRAHPSHVEKLTEVYKARRINGVDVGDKMVYLSPSNREKGLMRGGALRTTPSGLLVVNGIVISNMYMWAV